MRDKSITPYLVLVGVVASTVVGMVGVRATLAADDTPATLSRDEALDRAIEACNEVAELRAELAAMHARIRYLEEHCLIVHEDPTEPAPGTSPPKAPAYD